VIYAIDGILVRLVDFDWRFYVVAYVLFYLAKKIGDDLKLELLQNQLEKLTLAVQQRNERKPPVCFNCVTRGITVETN